MTSTWGGRLSGAPRPARNGCPTVPRKNSRRAPVRSCGYRLVVQSAEHWFRDDAMTITNLMAAGEWCEAFVRRIGNPWSQAGVRAIAIVVTDPFPKQTPHVVVHSAESRNPDTHDGSCRSGVCRTRSACGARTGVLRTVVGPTSPRSTLCCATTCRTSSSASIR